MMSRNTATIASGLAAAVLGGGVTTALLLAPSITSAAPPTSEVTDETADDDAAAAATEPSESDEVGAGTARREFVLEMLQPLVDDGTLTAEQAGAIAEQFAGAMQAPTIIVHQGGPGFPGGVFPGGGFPGFPGDDEGELVEPGRHDGPLRRGIRPIDAEVLAEALGLDVEELGDELRAGSTIAEIAEANGVELRTVIDALVDDYADRVTEWLEGEEQSPTTEATEPADTTATTAA
jgi:hypothetical protein